MSLIDELKKKLEPTEALIFYQCSGDVYVEHRSITNGRMGAGQPLDADQLARMVRCAEKYAKEQSPISRIGGPIPKNLLYASTDTDMMKLVWWRAPEERKMFFSDEIGIPNGVMSVPGMVYSVKGTGTLSVWCFRGRKPRGVLYRAPFFNVYQDGHVCLGNSKTEKPRENTFAEWQAYWEKMFWQSEFASLIADNPVEGNLATITKQCIEQHTPFPVDVMKRARQTLDELLK